MLTKEQEQLKVDLNRLLYLDTVNGVKVYRDLVMGVYIIDPKGADRWTFNREQIVGITEEINRGESKKYQKHKQYYFK
jgi:hypothetical protein